MERACIFADDVTDLAQQVLLGHAFGQQGTPALVVDPSGNIQWMNEAYLRLTGFSKDDVLRIAAGPLYGENARDPCLPFMMPAVSYREPLRRERTYTRRDGSTYVTDELVAPLFDQHGAVSHFVVTMHDITSSKEALHQQRLLSNHDVLTGLACRSRIVELVPEAIARAQQSGRTLAMLFIDLDGFKAVNDGHGHHCGDLVLKAVGARLESAVRSSDTVARFGGDEFVILLPTISRRSVARRLGNKIVRLAAEPIAIGNGCHQLSASVGVAFYPEDGTGFDALLISADRAMYAAKRDGGNRVRLARTSTCALAARDRWP